MRRALTGIGLAVALVVAFVSCADDERYVYTARRFDAANACLGPFTPIERVVGEGTSPNCPPTCLTFKDALYVSPLCPPVPVEATEVDAEDPACQAAVEAFENEALCDAPADEDGGEDGGSEEAGEEEDGAADGGTAEEDAAEEG
jgi:hypothetical protein